MRKILGCLGVLSSLVIQSPTPADACGDKLLLLGRGIQFQSRHTPHAATVLLYLPAVNRGALVDPKLESALSEAGHKLRSVITRNELDEALQSGQYDVLLADYADAPELQRAVATAQSNPVVLPAVYLVATVGPQQAKQQSKADAARAAKEFSVVLQVPGRPGHYCSAVDKAMALKLKRERSKPPRR